MWYLAVSSGDKRKASDHKIEKFGDNDDGLLNVHYTRPEPRKGGHKPPLHKSCNLPINVKLHYVKFLPPFHIFQ